MSIMMMMIQAVHEALRQKEPNFKQNNVQNF